MSHAAIKGIALEFAKSPQLRGFGEPEEIPPPTRCFLLSPGGKGKAQTLLSACESIQGMLSNRAKSPDWLIMVDEYHVVSSLAVEILHSQIKRSSLPLPGSRDWVLFYCTKLPDRWSLDEASRFRDELKSAIEFLSGIVTPETSAADPADDDDERRLQLAQERRARLLTQETWIDAPTVDVQQGRSPDSQGINNTANRLRCRGELLGAWNGREFLHPTFQFQPETGRLMPEMKILLEILPEDRSGWRQAFWLYQAHRQLDGARPADVFAKDPQAVIKAVRSDFETSDEHW